MINLDDYDIELHREAEANLIADAPKLLAEVKRLEARVSELLHVIIYIRGETDKVIE